jgi:choline dehydrogenase-like flavoprotein
VPEGLSSSQRAVLSAVCETLLPDMQVDPDPTGFFATGARTARTAERVERLIGQLQDPLDRLRLRVLLSTLGSPIANFATTGRFASLTRMDGRAREATLRGWALSRIPLRRAGFQALKRLAHVAYYCWPLDRTGHPAWRAAGYPGPLPEPATRIEPLPTVTVDRDTTLECDVAVIGSGAGGGVVAGLLAKAGRSVVVLEKGPNPGSRDMTQVEGDMLGALYLDGALLMTQSGSLPILAGSCVGGGTVINYTTSFPLPERARVEWNALSGLSLFTTPDFEASFGRVNQRLNVGTRWSTPGMRDAILERGCRALGWHVEAIPRNVTDCKESLECGYCTYGCRHGAKNSTARTYLADATGAGARLVSQCTAERITIERGRATGVVASVPGADGLPHTLTLRAKVVVAACGAVNTPALLVRSGLAAAAIGRGLRLHPATAVAGIFRERVEPWTGGLQTRYSDQLADQDDGYGVKFETAPVHFALPASGFGWESARQFKQDVGRLGNLSIVGVLLRDRDAGRIAVSRQGRARVHYELSRFDAGHVRAGLRGAAQVLAAAGATEIFSLHTPPARVHPGETGWLDRFVGQCDSRGYRRCHMSYISFHQMGSAAMGGDPGRSVVAETGEVHGVKGLYVADGSAFPTSSGVNPMITIMAIADHVAHAILGTS